MKKLIVVFALVAVAGCIAAEDAVMEDPVLDYDAVEVEEVMPDTIG